jgi:hypothetical protein
LLLSARHTAWLEAVKRASLKDFRFHETRHTRSEADVAEVEEILVKGAIGQ